MMSAEGKLLWKGKSKQYGPKIKKGDLVKVLYNREKG